MALTTTPLAKPTQRSVTKQTVANTTANKDVRRGACTLYAVDISQTSGGTNTCSAKFYDAVNPTPGTTEPNMILPIANGGSLRVVISGGLAFANGLSFCAAEENGLAATTSPDSNTQVLVLTS